MTREAMQAVARVREVRERDSRLGLSTALAEQRACEAAADQARTLLSTTPPPATASARDFVYQRSVLAAWCQTLRQREQAIDSARVIADAARAHWQHDHTRLAAVESLIERRAAERRAEATRREVRELDDVAARLWQFRRAGDAS